MLMNRKIRSKLDCMFPQKDEILQQNEELNCHKQWKPGDCVSAVDFRQGKRWIEGRIEDVKNRIVWTQLPGGRQIRRHIDHIRLRQSVKDT